MTIVFDLDDTLVDFTGSERRSRSRMCAGLSGHTGIPPARVVETFRAVTDRHLADREARRRRAAETMLTFRTAVYAELLRELGQDPVRAPALAETHEKVRRQELALFPDARPALERLQTAGRRLILLANGLRDVQRAECEATGISGYFSLLLCKGELGWGKPDPRVFQAVGAGATMVGDSPESDIAPAQAAGWQAVWLNRNGRPYPAGRPAPDRIITSLDEL